MSTLVAEEAMVAMFVVLGVPDPAIAAALRELSDLDAGPEAVCRAPTGSDVCEIEDRDRDSNHVAPTGMA